MEYRKGDLGYGAPLGDCFSSLDGKTQGTEVRIFVIKGELNVRTVRFRNRIRMRKGDIQVFGGFRPG